VIEMAKKDPWLNVVPQFEIVMQLQRESLAELDPEGGAFDAKEQEDITGSHG
jgi:hypothetical protein